MKERADELLVGLGWTEIPSTMRETVNELNISHKEHVNFISHDREMHFGQTVS